jgi:hypothetical protein
MWARSTSRRNCSAGPFGRELFTKALEGIFTLYENFSFVLFRLRTYCEIGGCLPSGVGPSTRVLRFLMSASVKIKSSKTERLYSVVRIRSIRWPFNCTVVFGFGRSGGHSPPLVRCVPTLALVRGTSHRSGALRGPVFVTER